MQREILQSARAFIQHSVIASDGDMEGTPVAIVEAAGSGVPVISTLHSGIPDTVIHGKTGFLAAEGDVDMMSAYMKELLSRPEKAIKMGAEGRKLMLSQFSLELHLRTLSEIIQRSIENKSKH